MLAGPYLIVNNDKSSTFLVYHLLRRKLQRFLKSKNSTIIQRV